jgi:membrane protein required for beta-lactamase induction
MTFLTLIVALGILWSLPVSRLSLFHVSHSRLTAPFVNRIPAWAIILGFAVVLVLLSPLIYASAWFFFVVSLPLLLIALNKIDLDADFERVMKSWYAGDYEAMALHLEALTGRKLDEGDTVTDEMIEYAFDRLLVDFAGVIFWFVVLGPAGVVLYWLTREWVKSSEEKEGLLHQLWAIVNWPATILLAFCFALMGNFVAVAQKAQELMRDSLAQVNTFLMHTGFAGLGLSEAQGAVQWEVDRVRLEAAQALVVRAKIIFVALVALGVFLGVFY